MSRKLSNQFLFNYLIIFLVTILATVLAFVMLAFASNLISDKLVKNQFTASSIIKEDYTQIDTSEVVQNGGGVQVVNQEYEVVLSSGLNTLPQKQLNAAEFTAFLVESSAQPYHYDIIYQPAGEFWLIVTFPTSIRLDFSVIYNKEAIASDFVYAGRVLAAVITSYLILLALITLIYSRITAADIIIPLRKLCDGTRLLRQGDYSARVELHLKNEFAELQNTFNDMAVRIEQEMSLRKQAENDRRQLILDISHDLKNPMASIQGYAEFCLNRPELSSTKQREYLHIIYQNSQRATQLLAELFELSQLNSPEFIIKTEKTDICEFVRQICGELIPALEHANFAYEFTIPEKSIFALLDGARFRRVLQNLADNALRYNQAGTKLCVKLIEQPNCAVIHFANDGPKIPQQLAKDIFKPFVRGDAARTKGGSGLGLSIAKKIAQAHGGDLELANSQEQGVVFIITVPTI